MSEGCRHCYAERIAVRFSGPGEPFEGFAISSRHPWDQHRRPGWTGRVELIPEKLDEPFRWQKPCRVFVDSMSDLFHEALPDEAIARVFAVMAAAERHTFQILTKRAERMFRWMTDQRDRLMLSLDNIWVGDEASDLRDHEPRRSRERHV